MEFCKAFNAATENIEKNMPVPVEITVYSDKSFAFRHEKSTGELFFEKKPPGLPKAGKPLGVK